MRLLVSFMVAVVLKGYVWSNWKMVYQIGFWSDHFIRTIFERISCIKCLSLLGEPGNSWTGSSSARGKHPVCLLHEYCRAYSYPDPQVIDLSPRVQAMDHLPMFGFAFKIRGTKYPTGTGRNKKLAQQRAAVLALSKIKEGQTPKDVDAETDSLFAR